MSLTILYQSRDTAESPTLAFGGTYIHREAFTALRSADAILRQAKETAEQLREKSAQGFQEQLDKAHVLGIAQGRADAMAAILGTLEVERRMRELLSSRLAELVEHCVRNVLGELTPQELLRQRTLHLVRVAAIPGSATLYVCPQQVSLMQAAIAELTGSEGADFAGLTIVSDERCEPDALLLETKVGFIDANLRLTLQEARRIIERALAQATQRLKVEAW